MRRARRARRLLTLTAIAAVAALVLGVTGWVGASYLTLVRRQVAIADACERVEAASRQRLALVANLLGELDAVGGGRAAVEELVRARDAVATRRLDPQRVWDGEVYRAYLEAQARLGRALESARVALHDAARGPSRETWRGLDTQLSRQLERLELDRAACRAAVRSFPGSVLAGIAGLDPARVAAEAAPAAPRGGRRG